jgi:hypothetical protein
MCLATENTRQVRPAIVAFSHPKRYRPRGHRCEIKRGVRAGWMRRCFFTSVCYPGPAKRLVDYHNVPGSYHHSDVKISWGLFVIKQTGYISRAPYS